MQERVPVRAGETHPPRAASCRAVSPSQSCRFGSAPRACGPRGGSDVSRDCAHGKASAAGGEAAEASHPALSLGGHQEQPAHLQGVLVRGHMEWSARKLVELVWVCADAQQQLACRSGRLRVTGAAQRGESERLQIRGRGSASGANQHLGISGQARTNLHKVAVRRAVQRGPALEPQRQILRP